MVNQTVSFSNYAAACAWSGGAEQERGRARVPAASRLTGCGSRAIAFLAVAGALGVSSVARAADPQDVLRGISDGVGGGSSSSGGPSHFLAVVVLFVGVVLILVWWNNRQALPRKARQVNHSRKLLRQISRQIGLASDEVRQLKILAEVHERSSGQRLENPLTLLLCPSLLTQSLNNPEVKVDRRVIARMARRISQKKA